MTALSTASKGEASSSLFASPLLLDGVCPVVLKAQPKELFELVGEADEVSGSVERRKDVEEFIHRSPWVITYMTESLNFYYAVLIADKNNRVSHFSFMMDLPPNERFESLPSLDGYSVWCQVEPDTSDVP